MMHSIYIYTFQATIGLMETICRYKRKYVFSFIYRLQSANCLFTMSYTIALY